MTGPSRSSILRNVASTWAVTGASICYAFFSTPLIVRRLGVEQYGVWSYLNGLTGYSSLLYFGVGSALIRQVAVSLAAGEGLAPINRLASVAVTIFLGLGALAGALFLALAPWIPTLLGVGGDSHAAMDAAIACGLLGVQILCYFVASAYASIILGHDRFDLANLAQLSATLLRATGIAVVLQSSRPLLFLSALTTVSALAELLFVRAAAGHLAPGLRLRLCSPTRQELGALYSFGIPAFLMSTSSRLINYTDTTVLGTMLGARSVAIYSLPLQLSEYARTVVSGYASVLIARLSGYHARGDMDRLRDSYLQSSRVSTLLSTFVFGNVVALGAPFLDVWAGPGYGDPAYWVLIWLSAANLLGTVVTTVATPFCHALRILSWPAGVLLAEALCNLCLSIGLARSHGASGVAFATFLPALLSAWLVPRQVMRLLSITSRDIVVSVGLPALVMTAAIAATHRAFGTPAGPIGLGTIAIHGAATLPAAAAVAFVFATKNERAMLRRLLPLRERR